MQMAKRWGVEGLGIVDNLWIFLRIDALQFLVGGLFNAATSNGLLYFFRHFRAAILLCHLNQCIIQVATRQVLDGELNVVEKEDGNVALI